MAPELGHSPNPPEWTVPAPVRALMWWPPIAFVLVVVAPDAAAGFIAIAGAVLATLGVVASAVARRFSRAPTPEPIFASPDTADDVAEQRAA